MIGISRSCLHHTTNVCFSKEQEALLERFENETLRELIDVDGAIVDSHLTLDSLKVSP